MASRISRLGSLFVNLLLVFLTMFVGRIIWWFIVAPRGQNPGKAVRTPWSGSNHFRSCGLISDEQYAEERKAIVDRL